MKYGLVFEFLDFEWWNFGGWSDPWNLSLDKTNTCPDTGQYSKEFQKSVQIGI